LHALNIELMIAMRLHDIDTMSDLYYMMILRTLYLVAVKLQTDPLN